ncbi:MAG: response regulator transcription factor [Anaerolineales bacterium]
MAHCNRKSLQVVLIEDHHIMRRGLGSLLTSERDIKIIAEAGSGEEALALINQDNLPDLVVIDIALPGMDGIETTRQIRQRYPQIKVLILSMYNNPFLVNQAFRAGAHGYVLKQSMVEELFEAIDKVMKGDNFISANIPYSMGITLGGKQDFGTELTVRESEILNLLVHGLTPKEIANQLTISIYTVYTHINTIKQKLGLTKNADLIRYAIENEMVLKPSSKD